MGTKKILITIYKFKKPLKPITENQYNIIKNNPLEIYPSQQNAFIETYKEFPFFITFLIISSFTIIIPIFYFITGEIDELSSYYNTVQKRNEFNYKIYKYIYTSLNYNDFCLQYEKI
jgi:hypothetical protein